MTEPSDSKLTAFRWHFKPDKPVSPPPVTVVSRQLLAPLSFWREELKITYYLDKKWVEAKIFYLYSWQSRIASKVINSILPFLMTILGIFPFFIFSIYISRHLTWLLFIVLIVIIIIVIVFWTTFIILRV